MRESYQVEKFMRRRDRASPRRRLLRIVRNSLWLSLTHYATPPFSQKSRSARLFGCKRPHDGSLSLPTFAVCGQWQALSEFYIKFNSCFRPIFEGAVVFLEVKND